MGNYQGGGDRGSRFGGGGGGGRQSFQKKSWGDDRPREMHKATCSECGKSCEVPFKPTGEKPVYCSDCFTSRRGDEDSRRPRQDFGNRGPRKSFGDRPNYQSTPRHSPQGSDDTKNILAEISNKLDRLIVSMEKLSGVAKPAPALVLAKKVEEKKPAVKPLAKKKVVLKAKKKK